MSGTYPTSPAPREVELGQVTTTLVSYGQSLRRQARSRGGQRWSLKFIYPPMTRAQFAPLLAFLVKQRGRYETFEVVLPPPLNLPQGAIPGSPTVDNESAGSPTSLQTGLRNIATAGWTANRSGILLAADFVKFTGHTKVYMVTEDAQSNSAGQSVLAIEPALQDGPAQGSAITVSNVPFTMELASDTLKTVLQVNPQFGLEVEMKEAY